ncbi:MAG: VWA domain-containing protein [Spirochaetales bacterium]|nr:VWA domain-containing protein [Spirochaetales bacterium]
MDKRKGPLFNTPRSAIIAIVLVVVAGSSIARCAERERSAVAVQAAGGSEQSPAAAQDGYVLRFGEDFNPALAARDDLGIAVVVAVDVSGSMAAAPAAGGRAKYVQASMAFSQVADTLERIAAEAPEGQVVKAGVLAFSSEVRELLPLVALDAEGLARLRVIVEDPRSFMPEGSTAIGSAIEAGVERLALSGLILRSLIVVTDGENARGADPADVLEAVRANRSSASTEDNPVFTSSTLVSFIGFDIDAGRFEPLESYGARVLGAADQEELARALSNLLEADATRLEAAGEARP